MPQWPIQSFTRSKSLRDRIVCRPMKGTAARGRTQVEDLAQAEALRASEKERAENVMIVDMVRHDLGRVAEVGSVNVPCLFAVEIEGKLCTPPVQCGLLPGTLRADLLEQGMLFERAITMEEVLQSPRMFLLNSVRGMYRVQAVAAADGILTTTNQNRTPNIQ